MGRVAAARSWLKRTVIGDPHRVPRRLLLVALVGSLALAVAGAYYGLQAGIQTGGRSLPYLRPVLQIATSTWAYVAVLLWVLRRFFLYRDRKNAALAAEKTGYDVDSIRRLAEEAKQPDGTTRAIITADDDPDEAAARIREAIVEADDDTLHRRDPEEVAADMVDDGAASEAARGRVDGLTDPDADLDVPLADLSEHALYLRAEALEAALDEQFEAVLTTDLDPLALAALDEDERAAPADLLPDGHAMVDRMEAMTERLDRVVEELDRRAAIPDPRPVDGDADSAVTEAGPHWPTGAIPALVGFLAAALVTTVAWLALLATGVTITPAMLVVGAGGAVAVGVATALGTGLYRFLRARIERRRGPAPYARALDASALAADRDDGDAGAVADRDPEAEWRREWQMFKLDVASTANFSDLGWQLAAPAVVSFVAMLILVQFWTTWWFYPVMLAGAVAIGTLNYARVQRKRRKRLDSLRETETIEPWDMVGVRVKRVETPERAMHYAWLAGRRYAHPDLDQFATEVGFRAYETANGIPISPSIQEKYARQLAQQYPDLEGYRDQERHDIMEWLLTRVGEADLPIVPKPQLIEAAIEHDIEDRRLGLGTKGKGWDPQLVREAYKALVPAALVEEEVRIQQGTGEPDADAPTVTAVRLTGDSLPPGYGEIRSQFSAAFANYAEWDPIYQLPDADDEMDLEPDFVDALHVEADDVAVDVEQHGEPVGPVATDGGVDS